MIMDARFGANLAFVKSNYPTIYKETIYAERNIYTHPYLSLNRLRVVFEALVDEILCGLGVIPKHKSSYYDRLCLLRGKLPDALWRDLEDIRPICNAASHELIAGEAKYEYVSSKALDGLRISKDLAIWFFEKVKREKIETFDFVPPPEVSVEELLLNAHYGDSGAAFDVAQWHASREHCPAENREFHHRMFKTFINEASAKGYYPAKLLKAFALVHQSIEQADIWEGIDLLDELIKEGEIIGVYHDKAIALKRLNQTSAAATVALTGAKIGDPYAMTLVAQWAGDDRHKIQLNDLKRMEMLEKSIEIAFHDEAAYYLSMHYEDLGRFDEAISLMEKCIERKEDNRGLLHSRLASILLSSGRDKARAFLLYDLYANRNYFSALMTAEELAGFHFFEESIHYFKQALTNAMDSEIVQNIEVFSSVRDRLLNSDRFNERDHISLTVCLGDAWDPTLPG